MTDDDLTNNEINSLREAARFHIALRGDDMTRLETVCATYGLSKAAAIRMALVAMFRELGLIDKL